MEIEYKNIINDILHWDYRVLNRNLKTYNLINDTNFTLDDLCIYVKNEGVTFCYQFITKRTSKQSILDKISQQIYKDYKLLTLKIDEIIIGSKIYVHQKTKKFVWYYKNVRWTTVYLLYNQKYEFYIETSSVTENLKSISRLHDMDKSIIPNIISSRLNLLKNIHADIIYKV